MPSLRFFGTIITGMIQKCNIKAGKAGLAGIGKGDRLSLTGKNRIVTISSNGKSFAC
jgi:hypothetical protein